jgi:hypothetical protein
MGFLGDFFLTVKTVTDASRSSGVYYNMGAIYFGLEDESNLKLADIIKANIDASSFLKLRLEFNNFFFEKNEQCKEGAIKFLVAFNAFKFSKDGRDWDWSLIRSVAQDGLIEMTKRPDIFSGAALSEINYYTECIKDFYEIGNRMARCKSKNNGVEK